MEIPLDPAFIRSVLTDEHDAATRDLAVDGVMPALERSQQRHEDRIATARDVSTLACRAGCTWCCHFSIDVRPAEVLSIVEFVDRTFAEAERTRIRDEAQRNAALLDGLDDEQRMFRNVRCPFLAEGRCSIYTVRPQTCRNYHATDVAGCKQSYEEPGNLDIDPEFAPYVYQAGGAHVEAFSEALREAGYDVGAYEFNAALSAAWSQPEARRRFLDRKRPFRGLRGEDIPAEFQEIAEEP
ncbi:MAG: YkgJ family cysteine cluster protein [Steroidobacteraceae bacterium]